MTPESIANIPDDLKAYPQWVVWRYTDSEGRPKPSKLPFNPKTGGVASVSDPTTWATFEESVAVAADYSGIGFVLTAYDPFTCWDFDDCIQKDGEYHPQIIKFLEATASYAERSPSGRGIHVFIRAVLPEGKRRVGQVEVYDQARFLTMTGNAISEYRSIEERQAVMLKWYNRYFSSSLPEISSLPKPEKVSVSTLSDDDALLHQAANAKNGIKVAALLSGDINGYTSQSEADLALCSMLAFYTDDAGQIDRLVRNSGLYRADKWDRSVGNGQTYGAKTIQVAIENKKETMSRIESSPRRFDAFAVARNDSTVESETNWEVPVPLGTTVLPDFPTDILPDWLRQYVEAEAHATQTPADLAGMLGLAVVATSVMGKAKICPKNDWTEPLNLYSVTVMPPGSRKSQVVADMMRPIQDFEVEVNESEKVSIAHARQQREIMEEERKAQQKLAAVVTSSAEKRTYAKEEALRLAGELALTPEPVPYRLLAEDCTPERLASLLAEQKGRMAVLSAEGDVFDIIAGRNSDKGPNMGVFLKGHSGDEIRVDRVGGKRTEHIPSPALTLGLAVQPDVLKGLMQVREFRGRGLVQRFLYTLPKDNVGHRDTRASAVPENVKRNYSLSVKALLALEPGKDSQGKPIARIIRLDAEATEVFQEYDDLIEVELRPEGRLGQGDIREWGNKLRGAVLRIAGLLHLAKVGQMGNIWEQEVNRETIEAAIKLGGYIVSHAEAAFFEMGADPALHDARRILDYLRRNAHNEFKSSTLWASMRNSHIKAATDIEPALRLLEVHQYIRLVEEPNGQRKPGRPSAPKYEVNPALHG